MIIGLVLIIGAFVGIAAFFGALLNWNFIMAGSASTNGLFLVIAIQSGESFEQERYGYTKEHAQTE